MWAGGVNLHEWPDAPQISARAYRAESESVGGRFKLKFEIEIPSPLA